MVCLELLYFETRMEGKSNLFVGCPYRASMQRLFWLLQWGGGGKACIHWQAYAMRFYFKGACGRGAWEGRGRGGKDHICLGCCLF